MQTNIRPQTEISFSLKRLAFNENYCPLESTRATTNFANLARGPERIENLRKTLRMIDNRFNALAHWDNHNADRYALDIEIISVEISFGADKDSPPLPLIEMLETTIIDRKYNKRIKGVTGNSFSSYLRDYDFSLLLPKHIAHFPEPALPSDFGLLHGKLFRYFANSSTYRETFAKAPLFCLSLSTSRSYQRNGNSHPVLGAEYIQDAPSRTDDYFALMGCKVRFFMPKGSRAPLAFYYSGELLSDYSDLELLSCIATMESFQRIYRPEIYNANATAAALYRPSLTHQDHSLSRITYDRQERAELARKQGAFAETHLVLPYGNLLAQWASTFA